MEIIGDHYEKTEKILDHCPPGADLAHAEGEMGVSHHAMFAMHVFVKHRDV
jgi:hypothetical protein